ncbi:hypothetical protein K3495_g227 [Podosphaera aphanis]|nr:hypothetical protein K3495_g227 [Podosphaera aphanis]
MASTNENIQAFEEQNSREWDNDTILVIESNASSNDSESKSQDNILSSPRPQAQLKTTVARTEVAAVPQNIQNPWSQRKKAQAPGIHHTFQRSCLRKQNIQSSSLTHEKRETKALRKWAKPEGLVTARMATYRQVSASEKAEEQKYLDPPDEKEEFPAMGYYLWPYWYESPVILLGPRLEDLNPVRLENRVWIEWDETSKCINISTRSTRAVVGTLEDAVKGIRDVIEHAKAARITASPLHIVHPPNSVVMRKLIKPKVVEKNPLKAAKIELEGEELSRKEKLEWEASRNGKLSFNSQLLRNHLSGKLLIYAPVKNWMRLRVHFGNININQYTNEFATTGSSWSSFVVMVKNPRFSAFIDRKLALILKDKITHWPDAFCSVNGCTKLEDVPFKDTEIIHFRINNQLFRMEGEMDRSFDNPKQAYQMGSNSLYKDNRRNVLVEARTIDIERGLDWKLELIADNKDKVATLPLELRNLIQDSVPTQTKLREDSLGLQFPDVTPKSSHCVFISTVCVRSVVQYRMKDSGYIVEIVIYREWMAPTTKGKPIISCSVSMFHPDWDDQTQDLSSKSYGREWKNDLSDFFKAHTDCDDGFEYFLTQVRTIQKYIVEAKGELSQRLKLK